MLPEIAVPVFETTLPSTGEKVKYRPYLVKEEKVLLMAHQGKDPKEVANAVKSLLRSCILTEEVAIEKLPSFDLEWLFLKIRAKSVGEIVEARMVVPQNMCGKNKEKCLLDIQANIDKAVVKRDPEHTNKVQLNDDIGLVLSYPNMEILGELVDAQSDNKVDSLLEVIAKCVKTVYDHDTAYQRPNYQGDWDADVKKLLDNLSHAQMEKISKFFGTMPKVSCHVKQKCPECGKDVERDIQGLMDFFT